MQLKDKHFEEARKEYEQQLATGHLTLEVANNLTDLYLQIGAVDKAIDTMQKYVAMHPDNLPARQKLGTLYQYAQRPDDYLKNLEEINKLKPTAENLTTLSNIYSFKGDYNKEAKALRDLIISEKGKDPKHFTDLATILAAQHDYADTASTLRDLQKTHPDKFTFDNEKLLVSVLLDNRQSEDGEKAAEDWIVSHDNTPQGPAEGAELINMVHFRGTTPLAEKLISHYDDNTINVSPDLLQSYIYIQLSENKYDEAYQRLRKLYDEKRLPPALNGELLNLAAMRGEKNLVLQILKETPLINLSETELLTLVGLGLTQNEPFLISSISDKFHDEESKRQYPALTAALALIHKQNNANELLARLENTDISHEALLQVADICAHYKNTDCVNKLLAKLPDASQLTDTEIVSVGEIYLKLHDLDKGYDYLTKALATRTTPSPDIEQMIALFAAARGDTNSVETWIGNHPDTATDHMFMDLYYAAADNQKYATATYIAETFHNKYNIPVSRTLLASSYAKSERYAQAIKLVKQNNPMSETDEDTYFLCLVKLAQHNPQYKKELAIYARKKINEGNFSEQKKMDFIYALIESGQTDTAMPYIHQLALKSGGQWAALYAEILDKKGRFNESNAFWTEVAKQPRTTAKEKVEIAYTLLDHNDKKDAESIFMGLAANARANTTPVSELLYIWGPRPLPTEMKWLEKRYVDAAGQEQQRWLEIINEHATQEFIVQFVGRHPSSIHNRHIANSYFNALAENHQLASKENYYIQQAKDSKDTGLIKEYAEAAKDHNLRRESRKAYETIASLEPDNYVAIREAGDMAFEQADYKASQHYLSNYTHNYKPERTDDKEAYLAFFYYAEIMRKDHDIKDAKPYYQKTLDIMRSGMPDEANAYAVKAQSQVWVGNVKGGTETFEAAVQEFPQDRDLRANYIETLVEIQQYDKARKLLKASMPKKHNKQVQYPLPSFITPVRDFVLMRHDHELLIYFSTHLHEEDVKKAKALTWAEYDGDGYDTLLLTAQQGYKFSAALNGSTPKMDTNLLHLKLLPGSDSDLPNSSHAKPLESVKP